jgi:hypothetical protein
VLRIAFAFLTANNKSSEFGFERSAPNQTVKCRWCQHSHIVSERDMTSHCNLYGLCMMSRGAAESCVMSEGKDRDVKRNDRWDGFQFPRF